MEITEIKISLMERDETDPDLEKTGKFNYIIRSSLTFDPVKYFSENYRESPEEINFENFLESSLKILFDSLVKSTKHLVDSVMIRVQISGESYELAMALEDLDHMEKYGNSGIIPIYEMFKMTITDESQIGK